MIIYIVKFSACLAILLLFYKIFLENVSFHKVKRYYLIVAILLSIGIPLITLTTFIESQNPSLFFQMGHFEPISPEFTAPANYLPTLLWSVYGLGVLFFGFKFYRNLTSLLNKIKMNTNLKVRNFFYVLLEDSIVPHTFLNHIFFNKDKFEQYQIPQEVIWHEEAHAQEKHSLDILFIEMMRVVFWFNPLIYFTKHLIKLNHEFLADQSVIAKGANKTNYQQTLLAFSENRQLPQLTNAINYSIIKKRFTIMKTNTSKSNILIRTLAILPMLAILLYSFSDRKSVEKDPSQSQDGKIIEKSVPDQYSKSNIQKLNIINTQETSTNKTKPQDKASKEEIAEYNALAKKYNEMPKEEMFVKKEEIMRLKYIYHLMTEKQRKNAEPFPKIPAPPPPPPHAKADQDQSKEFEIAFLKYSMEAKTYAYGVQEYHESRKPEEYDKLNKQYIKVMKMYAEYEKLAKQEKNLPSPPPPPPPAPKKK